ncbi:MAG: hypothetical protein ACMUEL_07955 [Flavobacteriales bacterium Tduv]
MMLLNFWYDLSDVGTEELVKKYLRCMRFFFSDWKIRSQIIRLYEDFAMK